jgi:UDP-perosamine 4-acetyltransferase
VNDTEGIYNPKETLMVRVVGLGAGGHAKVVIEILQSSQGGELEGLTDPKPSLWGTDVLGVPVLGDDRLLSELLKDGVGAAFVGLGCTGDSQPRRSLYDSAQKMGFDMIRLVHPRACVSPSATCGQGLTVMPGAIINAQARLGENVIINSAAVVEHDCVLGDHVHIAPGAKLASEVHVGVGSHVGMGAIVLAGISIGAQVIVGAGSVVTRAVADGEVVVGVPAKTMERRNGHVRSYKIPGLLP